MVLTVCAGLLGSGAWAQDLGGLARFLGGSLHGTWDGAELQLELSQGVPWRIFTLTEPDRVVIDFREVDWRGADPEKLLGSDSITALRFGTFRPGWSRLVAEMARPMLVQQAGVSIDPDSGMSVLTVTLAGADRAAFDARAKAPEGPGWDLPTGADVRPAPPRGQGPMVVMIDPGHGGLDPGAEAADASEADLMLTFARELRDVLLRAGDFEVSMTRDADIFVSLEARVALAHASGADVFISLHADSIDQGVAQGATLYTLAKRASDSASAALAERHDRDDLLAGVDLSGSDDRVATVLMDIARLDNTPRSQAVAGHLLAGIRQAEVTVHKYPLRQADFSVLKAADIPSVLIELGFLSTDVDLRNLQDPDWRADMAAGIRDGLRAWTLEDEALEPLRRQ